MGKSGKKSGTLAGWIKHNQHLLILKRIWNLTDVMLRQVRIVEHYPQQRYQTVYGNRNVHEFRGIALFKIVGNYCDAQKN